MKQTDDTKGKYASEVEDSTENALEMFGAGYEPVRLKDESKDKTYFTITPRIVWALCDDPFEYTLWGVVKDIAGEKGVCILSREDLATLAMMSPAKVSGCRDNLIAKGLLNGLLIRDKGYPKAVWHLTIPDLWEENILWAKAHLKIEDRVAYKFLGKVPSRGDESKVPSRGDESKVPSRGVKVPSPHEDKEEDIKEELINNNIFTTYEKEIGLLTSFIADDLKSYEKEFSAEWIIQAIHIAAENNKRSWGYVKGILKGAKEKGMSPELVKTQMATPQKTTYTKQTKTPQPPQQDNFLAELAAKKIRLQQQVNQ